MSIPDFTVRLIPGPAPRKPATSQEAPFQNPDLKVWRFGAQPCPVDESEEQGGGGGAGVNNALTRQN